MGSPGTAVKAPPIATALAPTGTCRKAKPAVPAGAEPDIIASKAAARIFFIDILRFAILLNNR